MYTPKNAIEALELAKRTERARQILAEGYGFEKDEFGTVSVSKPGKMEAVYFINLFHPGCDCPDALKTGKPCKHEIAWGLLQEEAARDAAMCERYEEEQAGRAFMEADAIDGNLRGSYGVEF